ncbi:hypothetical protein IWX65_002724 [Arthrobacter sp. CAN_A214]
MSESSVTSEEPVQPSLGRHYNRGRLAYLHRRVHPETPETGKAGVAEGSVLVTDQDRRQGIERIDRGNPREKPTETIRDS